MTAFEETVRERKRLIPSSRHRKRGSKSRFVLLPHEFLSVAQRRKMNGKVKVYKMKKPMTWREFMALPDDLAGEYINEISSKYHVNYAALKDMFDVSPASMRSAFKTRGISFTPPHGTMAKEDAEAWQSFIGSARDFPTENKAQVEATPQHEPEKPHHMNMSRFTLNFDGPLNSQNLLQTLSFMIGEGTSCNIHIEVSK